MLSTSQLSTSWPFKVTALNVTAFDVKDGRWDRQALEQLSGPRLEAAAVRRKA
ncbi:MAG: hypothetical protein AAF171_10815 [Cyanobacteria bacterium P01_A01_bin.116]